MAPTFSLLVSSFALSSVVLGLPAKRATQCEDGSEYDYIIVGGGLTGLVVANRLSELKNRTVLVIENGKIDDSPATQIPNAANNLNAASSYSIAGAPEPALANLTYAVQVGNVVGGGSVVNGMAFDRASAADYNAWKELGNEGWDWEGLLPYFKKSTTFTPPKPELAKEFNMTWDASYYGTDGPLQASFPNFEYEDMKAIWQSFRDEGLPLPKEHASGEAVGAFWIPTALQAKSQKRSHARNAYYDPVSKRPNLELLTEHRVTEIVFVSKNYASGVEVISNTEKSKMTVHAKREVILAAGAVFTPQLLQLSGLGPKDVLEAAGVKVRKDFPAIGANFQDHPNANMFFNLENMAFPNAMSLASNATYNASAWEEYLTSQSGPYTYAHGSSLSFLSLPQLTPDYEKIVAQIKTQNSSSFLPSVYKNNPKLLKGFEAQRAITARLLSGNKAAAGEIPMAPLGVAINAIQRPLSRGTITLNPADKLGNPIIKFNTFQNPVDRTVLLAMIRWTRKHWASAALAKFKPVEVAPGQQAATDEDALSALIAAGSVAPSFAHQSGTAAMMPEEMGGVVGSDLLVHGMRGLSVVDASILPLIPATHLQATMYAVAEKAADIIKSRKE